MGCAWPRRQPGFPVKHALGYKSGLCHDRRSNLAGLLLPRIQQRHQLVAVSGRPAGSHRPTDRPSGRERRPAWVRAATAGGPVRKGRLDGAAMAGAAEIQGEIDAAGDGAGGRDMDPINPSKRWIDG